jgi:hypothetical protein
LLRHGRTVASGASTIDGTGLFAVVRFDAAQEIGQLALGRAQTQGKHTLRIGAAHRLVKKPWRFLNHACQPSARLSVTDAAATLVAARALLPWDELTIDYNLLPENIGSPFECRCAECRRARVPSRIGTCAEPS